MATRAPFLKTRYGGYRHRHVPKSHVTPNVPTTACPSDISIGDAGDISIGDLHRVSAQDRNDTRCAK